jgi:hypothetical protein
MVKKEQVLEGIIAGVAAASINLLVEWRLNGGLVTADFTGSAILGVLTALAIIVLFRNRTNKNWP